jgi:PTH1 family peptidyl-tRNA hydrolase
LIAERKIIRVFWKSEAVGMKAIIGLGNPGREYEGTRHNVGFEVVDELARRWAARLKPWKGIAETVVVRDRDAILVKPTTFMNLSGEAARAVAAFYKIEPADVLVVVDEVQLPLGKLRLRLSGSDGGHNGLKSLIENLGIDFPRLRIGVERGDPERNLRDRVLSEFTRAEREVIDKAVQRAADCTEVFVKEGVLAAMNRFNAASPVADEADEDEKKGPIVEQ